MIVYIFLFMSTPEEIEACSLCKAANKLHTINVTYAEQNVKPENFAFGQNVALNFSMAQNNTLAMVA